MQGLILLKFSFFNRIVDSWNVEKVDVSGFYRESQNYLVWNKLLARNRRKFQRKPLRKLLFKITSQSLTAFHCLAQEYNTKSLARSRRD